MLWKCHCRCAAWGRLYSDARTLELLTSIVPRAGVVPPMSQANPGGDLQQLPRFIYPVLSLRRCCAWHGHNVSLVRAQTCRNEALCT